MSEPEGPIVDPASGLFTEAYLRASLPTRLATARRAMKQLGLVYLTVTDADGSLADPSIVGDLMRDTLRDSDTGVSLDDGRFAMMLEFTPVDGCVTITNRIRDRLLETHPELSFRAAVASYPVHAMDVRELFQAVDHASERAAQGDPGTVSVSPLAD